MVPITCNAVGDILALATLVLDVIRALNDARGSASEYRTFVDELAPRDVHDQADRLGCVGWSVVEVARNGEIRTSFAM